ncbi:hypothetical protein GQ53DRAFT_768843 [Thozetella sp. PMI_491]|nr:hypothetical protein GQ53DRAFT_768843 [Thozetella sp. PMI_491]
MPSTFGNEFLSSPGLYQGAPSKAKEKDKGKLTASNPKHTVRYLSGQPHKFVLKTREMRPNNDSSFSDPAVRLPFEARHTKEITPMTKKRVTFGHNTATASPTTPAVMMDKEKTNKVSEEHPWGVPKILPKFYDDDELEGGERLRRDWGKVKGAFGRLSGRLRSVTSSIALRETAEMSATQAAVRRKKSLPFFLRKKEKGEEEERD